MENGKMYYEEYEVDSEGNKMQIRNIEWKKA